MITLDNLLAEARSLSDTRRQIEQLQHKQTEQTLTESIWQALHNLLPEPLVQFAHFEAGGYPYDETSVTLQLDAIPAAPIWFSLELRQRDRTWHLRTNHSRNHCRWDDGYTVAQHWICNWDEYTDSAWQVISKYTHDNCQVTTDIVEALSYALDAWPAYNATCQEALRRNEVDVPLEDIPPAPCIPTPSEKLLTALQDYIYSLPDRSEVI